MMGNDTTARLDPPTRGLVAFGPPHDPRGPGDLHGVGERLEQGCHLPRAPSAAGVHPHLAQARPARNAGGLRHLLGEPAEGAQGQEPADGAAHERGGRQDTAVQAVQGAEASGSGSFSLLTGALPRVRFTAVRFILAFSVMLWLAAAPAWAQNGRAPALSAEAVLLLDADGKVLFSKNAAEDHAPASLVKLMTLYLAYEDLESGRAHWDEPVTVSRRAADTPRYRMGLRAGETASLGTLLEGVAIASANDAATAVSEHLGGTEEEFVARMNVKAGNLGLA